MFKKILIANRGELLYELFITCKEMGIKLSCILPLQKVCMLSLQMKQFVLVRRSNLSYLKCLV
jgi:biotin carboxylase